MLASWDGTLQLWFMLEDTTQITQAQLGVSYGTELQYQAVGQ